MNQKRILLLLLVCPYYWLAIAQSSPGGTGQPKGDAFYEKELARLRGNDDKKGIIALLQEYAEVEMVEARLQDAEEMVKESIRLSKELGMERLQWHYGLLGAIQIQRRESVEALKNELLAIDIGEKFGDTSTHMAEIYNYAAIIYSKM